MFYGLRAKLRKVKVEIMNDGGTRSLQTVYAAHSTSHQSYVAKRHFEELEAAVRTLNCARSSYEIQNRILTLTPTTNMRLAFHSIH